MRWFHVASWHRNKFEIVFQMQSIPVSVIRTLAIGTERYSREKEKKRKKTQRKRKKDDEHWKTRHNETWLKLLTFFCYKLETTRIIMYRINLQKNVHVHLTIVSTLFIRRPDPLPYKKRKDSSEGNTDYRKNFPRHTHRKYNLEKRIHHKIKASEGGR